MTMDFTSTETRAGRCATSASAKVWGRWLSVRLLRASEGKPRLVRPSDLEWRGRGEKTWSADSARRFPSAWNRRFASARGSHLRRRRCGVRRAFASRETLREWSGDSFPARALATARVVLISNHLVVLISNHLAVLISNHLAVLISNHLAVLISNHLAASPANSPSAAPLAAVAATASSPGSPRSRRPRRR